MARSSPNLALDNDPNPELRTELTAARSVLEPRIRGMHNLTKAAVTPELLDILQVQINEHQQRWDLVQAVISRLDDVRDALLALKNDGYPAVLEASAPALLFAELARELAAFQAAIAIFQEQAASLSIDVGEPVDKP